MKQFSVKVKIFVVCCIVFQMSCSRKIQPAIVVDKPPVVVEVEPPLPPVENTVIAEIPLAPLLAVAAARLDDYLPILDGKTVSLLVNHTAMIGDLHLADSLLRRGVRIQSIFAPEHGFRGTAADGEKIADGKDPKTGVPLVSLYGKKQAPSKEDLVGVDWLIFDVQDVGTRFYTYISTMHYAMEACARHGVKFMVLDRPNPNGHFVDGPTRKPGYESFVGLHPIPVAHGMTVGEYAQMINGEGWLPDSLKCDLTVIPCANYDHKTAYALPIKPSPNLPNMTAIYLYPSICYFEGTNVSIGRGTNKQFQVLGSPGFPKGDFEFTPVPMPGSINPPLEGKLCRGYDLSTLSPDSLRAVGRIDLSYLLNYYRDFPDKDNFFLKTLYIDKLAGSDELRKQIIAGKSEEDIRESWQADLEVFKVVRRKYLIYGDFE
ncbi:MAG: exo-beta-N-acetylmuramidase NamZ domain-containing protein [Saprospiraceae bacterium]